MESVYLKTLVEVVQVGSLSRAAEVLCVTQPAVSRRIKFLEDQYGCALLDRSGSQIRPTEAGRMVFDKACALLEIEAELQSGLQRLEGKVQLSFSCTPAFGSAHLPGILRDFMLECVDTADLKFLFLSPLETMRGIGEGLFDAAVIEGAALLDSATFTRIPLPDAETVFMTSASLGFPAFGTSVESLLTLPLYTRREGCCSRMLLERGLKGLGLSLKSFKKVIVLDDLNLLIQAVLSGHGTSFLPTDLVQSHLSEGRILEHRLAGFDHVRTRTLVVNGSCSPDTPLGQFLKSALSHFGLSSHAIVPPNVKTTPDSSASKSYAERLACPGCLPIATDQPAGIPRQVRGLSPKPPRH